MKMILCPCCGQQIEIPTYWSKNRQRLMEQYKQNKQNPEFVERRRKIALKCYHKKKNQS